MLRNACTRLDHDVLSMIFDYYAESCTSKYPIETLLLVCRTWNGIAHRHRIIWGRLDIVIGHRDTFASCFSYVRRRLELSGATAPLEIRIRIILGKTPSCCKGYPRPIPGLLCCEPAAGELACRILSLLAGPDGVDCYRWKSLDLNLIDPDVFKFSISKDEGPSLAALTYPTPALEYVSLSGLQVTGPILPACPSLISIQIGDAKLVGLPDVRAIVKAQFDWSASLGYDISSLATANNLQEIDVLAAEPGCIVYSASLPSVHTLRFRFYIPFGFEQLQFPNLKSLSFTFDHSMGLEELSKCSGIRFSALSALSLDYYPDGDDYRSFSAQLLGLLCTSTNLDSLDLDEFSLVVLLNHMWAIRRMLDTQDTITVISPFSGREVDIIGWEMTLSGNETLSHLEEVAARHDFPPLGCSENEIWEVYHSSDIGQ